MASVNVATAPLLAEYKARCGTSVVATTEQVFTIAGWAERRQMRQRSPAHPGHPDDVHVQHPVPLVVVVRGDVSDRSDAGVVHDNVDAAEFLGDGFDAP